MRIGIRAPRRKTNFGGVATYEQEMFEGILLSAKKFRHRLVIFGWTPQPPDLPCPEQIEWVQMRFVAVRHLAASCRRAVNLMFNRVLHLPSPFRSEHWIDSYLFQHRVDFFLNIIPEIIPTDVPFMTFVFDVLHRVHPYFPEGLQRGLWVRREDRLRQMTGRAAIIGVGTEVGKKEVLRFFPVADDSLHVLPFPTPNFALERAAEKPAANPAQARYGEYVFFPAGFHAHKNHATLLHALALLRDRHGLKLNLVLSGKDWGNLAYVQELIQRLDLGAQVHIAGFVSRAELHDLYQGALALVFPSLLGPDNIPPLEAFGLGCPAIVANIPGAAEQTDGAALLFPPTDEAALAAAILKVRDDPAFAATLVARGRIRAEKYTSARLGEMTLEILTAFEAKRRCWGLTQQYPNRFNWARLIGG
jgi:glycosyltransferase involved in cell wall biosynthesis